MKKTLFITILIMTNLFYIFAGGEARFDGMIVLTAEGEKCITGDDHGISRSVVVYGDCEIYFNNKICSIKLWELPVGVNVLYKGGISCGYVTESGSKICRPTAGYENEVYIKTQVIKVNREGCKSYAVETLVNDLLNDLYPHINTHLKGKYKNIIIGLMNINTSRQLKQDEEVVIPVMENGFLGSNSNISSEIVFPSLYKVVRIIADQDISSENTFDGRMYNNLVVISYKNSFSVIKIIKLPKDIYVTRYRMPLYYDGTEKYVVIAAAKWFFIYDVRVDKLSEKLVPQFKDVELADAQSGNLTFTGISPGREIVSGKAQDFGSFEYDVSIPSKPKQVDLPSEGESKTECSPYTPAKGDPERNAICDALREWIYKHYKVKVVLVVPYLKVFNGWAWVHTRPGSPDGSSHYEDVSGLIRKKNGDWEVVTIYSLYRECPDCEVDVEQYFKNLIKEYPGVPSCILPQF